MKKYLAITAMAAITLAAACDKIPAKPAAEDAAIRNALQSYLSQRGNLNMAGMDMDIQVARNDGKTADVNVTFRAKQGGGYYAYVSSKFSNRLIVVDPDPNGDGNPIDAKVAGTVGLVASRNTARDATITGNRGMGGQGILPVPVVYNGWVQNLPASWKNLLTPAQRNPFP